MTFYTPPGNSVEPLTNPNMVRPATHRPDDYDEDDGSDSLARVGELRFGTSREDYEHNHPDISSSWQYVGWAETAPKEHLWQCIASHDCPASMIHPCPGEGCQQCHPNT